MAEIHWLNPVDGNFDTASDWSGGVVPGKMDDAFLDAAGAPYTVTLTGQGVQFVATLHTASTATLDIIGGDLSAAYGADNGGTIALEQGGLFFVGSEAGGLTNSGTILLVDGSFMFPYSGIQNSGTISVGSQSDLGGGLTTLTGGGVISLSGGDIVGNSAPEGPDVITNVDNTIEGSGTIGGATKQHRRLLFTNEAAGVVDASTAKGLLEINVGKYTITNAGLIEATNRGDCVIDSAVDNTGTLEANGGTLTLDAAVTGSGVVDLAAGMVVIGNAGAAETVAFTGKKGALELDQSQTYAGQVSGFSTKGKTTLDLRDVGFVSANEATFSGTKTSGMLTVSDGTHTARITLVGNYTNATFVASSDGEGGVNIVDPSLQTPSVAHFAAAMATMTGHGAAAGTLHPDAAWSAHQPMLAGPSVAVA